MLLQVYRRKAAKSSLTNSQAIKRKGGRDKGLTINGKRTFSKDKKKFRWLLCSRGAICAKALRAWSLGEELFLRLSEGQQTNRLGLGGTFENLPCGSSAPIQAARSGIKTDKSAGKGTVISKCSERG